MAASTSEGVALSPGDDGDPLPSVRSSQLSSSQFAEDSAGALAEFSPVPSSAGALVAAEASPDAAAAPVDDDVAPKKTKRPAGVPTGTAFLVLFVALAAGILFGIPIGAALRG